MNRNYDLTPIAGAIMVIIALVLIVVGSGVEAIYDKITSFADDTVIASDSKIIELDFDVFTKLDELSINGLLEFEYSGQETVFGATYDNLSKYNKLSISEIGDITINDIRFGLINTNITLEYITPERLKKTISTLKNKDVISFTGKMLRYNRDKRVLTLELTALEVFSSKK